MVGRVLVKMSTIPEIFDKYALKYDKWYEENEFIYLSELEALKYFLSVKSKSLEIGTGTGRFASDLNIAVGVDVSFEMLKLAHAKCLNVFKANGERLPFKDNVFDTVLMITTLCFIRNPLVVLSETKRVLRKSGNIILGIIDKNSVLGKQYISSDSAFYAHANFFSPQEVIDLLEKVGFRNFSFRQTLFNDPRKLDECEFSKPNYGEGSFVVIKAQYS